VVAVDKGESEVWIVEEEAGAGTWRLARYEGVDVFGSDGAINFLGGV
jgi:hypothetical protein